MDEDKEFEFIKDSIKSGVKSPREIKEDNLRLTEQDQEELINVTAKEGDIYGHSSC